MRAKGVIRPWNGPFPIASGNRLAAAINNSSYTWRRDNPAPVPTRSTGLNNNVYFDCNVFTCQRNVVIGSWRTELWWRRSEGTWDRTTSNSIELQVLYFECVGKHELKAFSSVDLVSEPHLVGTNPCVGSARSFCHQVLWRCHPPTSTSVYRAFDSCLLFLLLFTNTLCVSFLCGFLSGSKVHLSKRWHSRGYWIFITQGDIVII